MSDAHPTIAVIETDPLVRDTINRLLASAGLGVASFNSAEEFLQVAGQQPFHCLLLDSKPPALDLQRALTEKRIPVPVVLLAGSVDVATVVRAMRCGALDVVEKPFADARLVEAVQHAIGLYNKWHKNLEDRKLAHERIAVLTPRELQVLDLMVEGKPNRMIAEELGISPKTLDIHRANVMHKMQARTTADLVRMRYLDRTDPMGLAFLCN